MGERIRATNHKVGAVVANEEHVQRLKQGVAKWNAWRAENPFEVDLSGLEMPLTDLTGVDGPNLDTHPLEEIGRAHV